jgi:putative ABC transport system substrate-binding protein
MVQAVRLPGKALAAVTLSRRSLLAVTAATLAPRAGWAQDRVPTSAVPTIGALVIDVPGADTFWQVFRQAMSDLGYVDGKSVRYAFRSGQSGKLDALAAELVQLNVDVIVTWYTPPAQAAKRATRKIPIVMALAGNPVETGLVESLARPGGNITGMAGSAAELASKCMELVREMVPHASTVVTLANGKDPFSKPFVEFAQNGAKAVDLTARPVFMMDPAELDGLFADMVRQRPDALLVQPSLPRRRVAELAIREKLPALSVIHGFVADGGLLSYAPSEPEIYRRAASIVDKILKGEKPSHIPVELPTKFELQVNLRTAKALGLRVQPELLARADDVVE